MARSSTPASQNKAKAAQDGPSADLSPAPLVPPAEGTQPDAGQGAGSDAPEAPQVPAGGDGKPAEGESNAEASQPADGADGDDGSDGSDDGSGAAPGSDPGSDDGAEQPPAEVASTAPAAAPLAPPVKPARRVPPPSPVVEPNAAMRLAPDDDHVGIVDQAGDPIHHEHLFTDEGKHLTWMLAAKRIYQTIRYPGQHPESQASGKILLFPAGARVPRDKAHQVIEMAKRAAGNADGEGAGASGPDADPGEQQQS